MVEDARFAALEKMIAEIHRSVVIIENDHGRKIDLALEGLAGVNQRLDRTDQRVAAIETTVSNLETKVAHIETKVAHIETKVAHIETKVAHIETDVHEIKGVLGLLKSIATDHESRLQKVENVVRDHLAGHPVNA